jgi:flagellar biosynthetic protein FliO
MVLAAAVANTDHTSIGGLLVRLVVSLLVVLLVLWVLSQIVRKRGLPGMRGGSRAGRPKPIDVLSRQSLGKGQTLVTVRMDERVLLLGVTPQSITTLSELDPTDYGFAPAAAGTVYEDDDTAIEVRSLPALSTASGGAPAGLLSPTWSQRIDRLRAMTVRR